MRPEIKDIKDTIVKLKSTSKINLGLWIKELRPDGYHNLETIFYESKNLYDEIIIKISDSTKPTLTVNFTDNLLNTQIPQETNLAFKAADLFFKTIDQNKHCEIQIKKNIPTQAGLGGGSSNAASVLKGLNTLFKDTLTEEKLIELGAQIGSDVAFFILGGTCFASGRGEKLEPLKNNLDLNIKVIKDENTSISTKWAYEEIDRRNNIPDYSKNITNIKAALKKNDFELLQKNIFNNFEEIIFKKYPVLMSYKDLLEKEGYTIFGLCGSGSAVFGLKPNS